MSSGHIRARSAGSFELRYRAGGRTKTETVKGGKRDAQRRLRELQTLVDQNRHPDDPDRLTVSQWLRRWLDQIRPDLARLTWRGYEAAVRVHIIPKLGDVLLKRLGPADIQGFYSALANAPLKASTRSQICTVLGAALSRAVEQRLIALSPADALKKRLPRVEKAKPTVLDAGQCEELLRHARQRADLYPAILLALSTGMRRSEILALKWGSVNLAAGEILVHEQVEQLPGSIRLKAPKNGESRTVTIPEPVAAELRRIKVEQAEQLLALGVRQNGDTRVCTRADGTVCNPNNLTELFRLFIRRTGLPVCRFHDLRHSHASQLLRLGVSVRVVADRLGHSDGGALLLKTYAHSDASMHAEAAHRLGAALFGKL